MDFLKNLPSDRVASLASLIDIRPERAVSMALSKSEHCDITLLAFGKGEGVSEEEYFGDVFYYVLEGDMPLNINGKIFLLKAGDCMAVGANIMHSIGGEEPFKLMQITLK